MPLQKEGTTKSEEVIAESLEDQNLNDELEEASKVEQEKAIREDIPEEIISESDKFQKQAAEKPDGVSTKPSNMLITPMLGSIDELLEETERELGDLKIEKVALDLDIVNSIWNEHIETVDSPSTKATLEKVLISISDEAVHVIVPSSVSKEEIAQELQLYQKLRDRFNNNELNIIIEIDRSQFPDLIEKQSSKMYTMKEKYEYLSNKNQELDNLVKALKLKIDQD